MYDGVCYKGRKLFLPSVYMYVCMYHVSCMHTLGKLMFTVHAAFTRVSVLDVYYTRYMDRCFLGENINILLLFCIREV